jgi:hypothetical protein
MIVIICLPCDLALRVMPTNAGSVSSQRELEELVGPRSAFWPDQYPCPQCNAMMRGMHEQKADSRAMQSLNLKDLTPQEAFAAFNGCGFPDEQRCSFAVVDALLRETPVRCIIGKDVIGLERTVLDAIELWDGTRIHLGAGGDGAVVYRITRPISYTRKALAKADADAPIPASEETTP